jgi:hypothetical protein
VDFRIVVFDILTSKVRSFMLPRFSLATRSGWPTLDINLEALGAHLHDSFLSLGLLVSELLAETVVETDHLMILQRLEAGKSIVCMNVSKKKK